MILTPLMISLNNRMSIILNRWFIFNYCERKRTTTIHSWLGHCVNTRFLKIDKFLRINMSVYTVVWYDKQWMPIQLIYVYCYAVWRWGFAECLAAWYARFINVVGVELYELYEKLYEKLYEYVWITCVSERWNKNKWDIICNYDESNHQTAPTVVLFGESLKEK